MLTPSTLVPLPRNHRHPKTGTAVPPKQRRKQRIAADDEIDEVVIAEPELTEKTAENVSAKSIGRVQAKLAMHLGKEGWAVLQKAGEEADEIRGS